MSFQIKLPLFATRHPLYGGSYVFLPFLDRESYRLNQPMSLLTGQFAESYQKGVLNKGNYASLLDVVQDQSFYKDQLTLFFPEAKDQVSYPNLELSYDYYFTESENGYWGIVPVLGIDGFAVTLPELIELLAHNIKLEFVRSKRFSSVHRIIPTIWYGESELRQMEVSFRLKTLAELESEENNDGPTWLERVANELHFTEQISFGRQSEIETVVNALKSQYIKNIILVGPSGVGKTALIWEVVRRRLKNKLSYRFWETTASVLIKELTGDTGWENNTSLFIQEISTQPVFLFVRNFLELFEVGQYSGNEVSMAEYIKPYVSRGEMNMITECTEEELARIELKSPNYLSFFHVIRITEPSDELDDIILSKITGIAKKLSISVDPEAIQETVRLNKRFTPYAGFPGKPIRFLESLLINLPGDKSVKRSIDRSAIIKSFCEETGMPPFMADPDIPMNPKTIKAKFNAEVFGQESPVDSIVDVLASVKSALTRTGKPIASFLFVGPTGVGKTELAKVLASIMFNSRKRMIRFDMSEFSDPYAVERLTGEGYFQDGLLTSAVRRDPFCVLLFDEIEKAYSGFYDLLLQILSEGRLTDSSGRLVNFCSTIIIMTSNIGAGNLQSNRIGWKKNDDTASVVSHFMGAVKKHFRPELFNRIDEVIPFHPLSKETVRFVVEREMAYFYQKEGVQFRPLELTIAPEVNDYLAEVGYDIRYGARQLQRAIREKLIIPLATELNAFDFDDKLIVNINLENDKIKIDAQADPMAFDRLLEELSKINTVDHASELRRKMTQLKEGPYCVQIENRLAQLHAKLRKAEKQKNAGAFWEDTQQVVEYHKLIKLDETQTTLAKTIEDLELNISLAVLDNLEYDKSIDKQLDEWKADFESFKLDLYSTANKSENIIYLSLYGGPLRQLYDFYQALFAQLNFEVSGEAVVYDENFYQEEVMVEETFYDEEGVKQTQQVTRARKEFLKFSFQGDDPEIFALATGKNRLMGVEFAVRASAVALYLQDENGIHHWISDSGAVYRYRVEMTEEKIATPENIMRQEYYKGNARRVFGPESLKDNRLQIKREINKRKYLSWIIEALEKRFKIRLDKTLFG